MSGLFKWVGLLMSMWMGRTIALSVVSVVLGSATALVSAMVLGLIGLCLGGFEQAFKFMECGVLVGVGVALLLVPISVRSLFRTFRIIHRIDHVFRHLEKGRNEQALRLAQDTSP
jgi:hypothetical protein